MQKKKKKKFSKEHKKFIKTTQLSTDFILQLWSVLHYLIIIYNNYFL